MRPSTRLRWFYKRWPEKKGGGASIGDYYKGTEGFGGRGPTGHSRWRWAGRVMRYSRGSGFRGRPRGGSGRSRTGSTSPPSGFRGLAYGRTSGRPTRGFFTPGGGPYTRGTHCHPGSGWRSGSKKGRAQRSVRYRGLMGLGNVPTRCCGSTGARRGPATRPSTCARSSLRRPASSSGPARPPTRPPFTTRGGTGSESLTSPGFCAARATHCGTLRATFAPMRGGPRGSSGFFWSAYRA